MRAIQLDGEADRLRAEIGRARALVAFTGAGISTESGIPDFRSPGSPWLRNAPIDFALFRRSEEARREAWRRKFAMDDLSRGAAPSRGHLALATLLRGGTAIGIVTQNVDGLHGASGVADEHLVELHGNGTYATCLDCARRHELADIRAAFEASDHAPRCAACGGAVKSATISFGQAMPEAAMGRAAEWAARCDLMLVLGSSLVVYPAATIPILAKRAGARLAIVNREATELDDIADVVVHGEIGPLLGPLAATH